MKGRVHLVAVIATLAIALPLVGQDEDRQDFVLRVDAQLVIQTVSVRDNDGNPIEGLTADDFVVTEDGVPQTISVFEFQRLDDAAPARPIGLTARVAVDESRDVGRISPAPAGGGYQDRRLLALYFDMSGMSDVARFRALGAALGFLQTDMTGADLVAILTYSEGEVDVLHDFTDDRAALSQVLLALLNDEYLDDGTIVFGQSSGEFNLFNTDRQLAALQTAVQMLEVLVEQKSLVYFGGGMSLSGIDNQAQLRATLNAARRANVAFYPVDARGLVALPPMGDASQRSPGGLTMYTGATAMASLRGFQRSQDTLYTLAADTGGRALLDSNDLGQGIVQAQRATSSYYILGYYPTNAARDGSLRRVSVTLRDRSADLSYRESYYADKEFRDFTEAERERQLEEALMLEDPITDITMAMELNYFQLNRAEYFVPLAVKIPGEELVRAQEAGARKTVIDVIGEVRNEYGTIITNLRDKVEIDLEGERADLLALRPVQYDAGFTLLPGNYTIKFLARNAETGRIGTYLADFVVPNLNLEEVRLPISSVVLSGQRVAMADALFNTGRDDEAREQTANPMVDDGLKLVPSVTRVFSVEQDLYVYLQAYERDAVETEPLAAYVMFFREDDRAFESPAFIVSEWVNARSKAVPIRLTIPAGSIEPGDYTILVAVLHPEGEKVAFWQTRIAVGE